MKNSLVRTLVMLSLSATLGSVALMAQGAMYATIPFDFMVNSKPFAAGDYCVRQVDQNVLLIHNVKNNSSIVAMTLATEANAGKQVIRFHRYGNSYFLFEISGSSRGWKLPTSRAEKEVLAGLESPSPVVLAVAARSKERQPGPNAPE